MDTKYCCTSASLSRCNFSFIICTQATGLCKLKTALIAKDNYQTVFFPVAAL